MGPIALYIIIGVMLLLVIALLMLAWHYRQLHRQLFQQSLRNPQQHNLIHSFGKALAKGEFSLKYQPKISVKTGKICGAEALVRWEHSKYGLILPAEFIELAEKSGFIIPLGQWILKTACQQAKILHTQGFSHVRIAINLSAEQFKMGDIVKDIAKTLDTFQLSPQMLEVELTESIFLMNSEQHLLMLKVLREMGVTIALDDFGTGYSSLKYLREFPLDALKIDQTFIHQLLANDENANIVKAMIALAKAVHMKTIAEGVESNDQAQLLAEWGVDELQGFYFYQPLTIDELITAIKQQAETKPVIFQK